MHRVDKLIALGCMSQGDKSQTAGVTHTAPLCDSMNLKSEILRDHNATFMIYYAIAGDTTRILKYFVDLETRLLLSRAHTEKDKRELFSRLGMCVAMEDTLKLDGKWNEATSEPSREIRREIEAMMHLELGHYKNKKAEKWWAEFYTTRFENAIPLLSGRNLLLKSGIAYFHASDEMLKHLCGIKIRESISNMQETLIHKNNPQVKQVYWLSNIIVSRLRRASEARFGSSAHAAHVPDSLKHLLQQEAIFDTVMKRAPLCMSSLLLKLQSSHGRGFKAGLENDERNILMTFLQASGVERQVSMKLFGNLSGLDEKSFKNKYGKSIDYFYKKDYNSFGCAKIQETGLCPFQSKKRVLELVDAVKFTVDIEECFVSNPPPCVSCSLYYKKCHGSGWNQDAIQNPKTYFMHAFEEVENAKRARPPDGDAGAPAAKRAPLTAEQKACIQKNREAALERQKRHKDQSGEGHKCDI
jgi:hypothetical protein